MKPEEPEKDHASANQESYEAVARIRVGGGEVVILIPRAKDDESAAVETWPGTEEWPEVGNDVY